MSTGTVAGASVAEIETMAGEAEGSVVVVAPASVQENSELLLAHSSDHEQ